MINNYHIIFSHNLPVITELEADECSLEHGFKVSFLDQCFVLGTVPIIRCPKGNAAEMVAEVIQPEIIIDCKLSAGLMSTVQLTLSCFACTCTFR